MNKKQLRKLIGQVHLWVGLIIGILFFVIALSGAIYTWAPEISRVIYKEKVKSRDIGFAPVSAFKQSLEKEFPEGDFRTIYYRDKKSAVEVLLYAPGTYYKAFMDPYSADLLHLQDMNKGWLNYIKFLHRNLILGDVGRKVVHWVTLLSFIMLISGVVLWWPKNKAQRPQRFKLRWNVSPWRLNYDLHNVLGFYASWILIFTTITGIYWGFEHVKNITKSISGEKTLVYEKPASDTTATLESSNAFTIMDSLAEVFLAKYPQKNIRISNPHGKQEAIGVVLINSRRLVYNTDHFYFDRYNGQSITGPFEFGRYEQRSTFHKVNGLVYDIHFGTILGLPGRLLVFFASLIAASLPITGFIIWYKKKKPSPN